MINFRRAGVKIPQPRPSGRGSFIGPRCWRIEWECSPYRWLPVPRDSSHLFSYTLSAGSSCSLYDRDDRPFPENLNAAVVAEDDEIEVVMLEADELWSYVGSKENPQWLWLVMHSKTRQIVAIQVGPRNKETAEKLFFKLPEPLKKKPSTILTTSLCIVRRSPIGSIDLLEKNQVRLLTLKDLTAHSGSDAQDL